VNVFQFTADFVTSLAEARRVTRRGGRVAVCNWGRVEDRQVQVISEPLVEPGLPRSDPIPIGEPGVLEDLARRAGLTPERADEVDVPYGSYRFDNRFRYLIARA
jgi:hypothetical protein